MSDLPAPVRPAIGAVRRSFAPWRDAASVPLIRLEHLSKHFGRVAAVDDLSLDLFEREFFCLLGPSGCGKSTLLRLLAGFEAPSAGRILLAGENLTGVPPYRRPVNMMFQSYALFPHLTVARNIAFGLKQERLPKDETAARVDEMLRLVQLAGLDDRYPEQLSGGQRQRVALARALAKRPKVLLLDEPLAALDKKLREETQFELMDLQVRLGTTFVVVTHDQEEAMAMADRIGIMDRGRLVQVATPGEIYEQPKTRFIAEFVGEVNIFEGRVAGREGALWQVATPFAAAPLLVEHPYEVLDVGQAVAVAVRPEKIVFHAEPPRDWANLLIGEVWDIGYLGDWTTYRVKLDGGGVVRATKANVSRFVEAPLTWNQRVHLSFAPGVAVILTR